MAENRNAQQVREITDKLEQGIQELFESERYKEYLNTMSKFYRYSFNNTLLIAMQKPEATLIAGYTAWQRNFDRHVMKGEKGIRILAPAPYKAQEERDKLDPATQMPVLDADGKPVKETVEVMRPAFKVVSVFDVSQTDGKELPDIAVDELTGSVENYAVFFEALKQESPVPISFEDIPGSAKGYFSHVENRIAIQENMSEIQTVKTAIHEIAHAKLHGENQPEPEPAWKVVMVSDGGTKRDFSSDFKSEAEAISAAEEADWHFVDENGFEWRLEVEEDLSAIQKIQKDRHTKEVEAESVAYTVCQRYGIETSDYSFGYIAGWSSDKETKELKSSLELIRSTAAEMIESIDAKVKVLMAEHEQVAAANEIKPSYLDVPVYYEAANYAFEAGELDECRASRDANLACAEAIEATINEHYSENRLSSEAALSTVLERFSSERVQCVLANTIQQKSSDGRISPQVKEWASAIFVPQDDRTSFIVDKVNPGLLNLFASEFMSHREAEEKAAPTVTDNRDPEVVAWEKDEITSFEVKVVDVVTPGLEKPDAPSATKHRLTTEEKQIKDAVMDRLKAQIAQNNDGMLATYRASDHSFKVMLQYGVRIEGNTVTQNGEPLFAIHRRHSTKKTQGCYRELTPTLEYIKRDKEQTVKQEKPSIREQLKAAKSQTERKTPAKSKSRDMGLE
jgi:antirestriction protein ArdC